MSRFVTGAAVVLLAVLAVTQPAAAADPWRKLHRPLHLPQLAAGAACPVSAVDRRVDWPSTNIFGGSGVGRGPVYPGLGGSGGNFTTQLSDAYPGPWFRGKIFWYVAPSYRGPVLIRGHRLDGPESLRFGGSSHPAREMRITRRSDIEWDGQPRGSRGVPAEMRIAAPGCYAAQIDGTSFSRVVVFTASTP